VQRHGGEIFITSEPGKGTVVNIHLPIGSRAGLRNHSPAPQPVAALDAVANEVRA
jgi:hypothetical protein